MFIRRFKKIGLLVPFVAVLVAALPASATTAGAGEVDGQVNLVPGYAPTSVVSSPQAFTFDSILISGVFASNSPTAECATDNLTNTTSVSGASTGLLGNPLLSGALFDAGTVNGFTEAGTCNLAGGGVPIQVVVSSGTFTRILSATSVGLSANCSINGSGVNCTVRVYANFVPAAPTQNPLQTFHFIGGYAVNG